MRDVDAQVLARQALARSERLFHLAMDGAPQGMAVVGRDLDFVQVNAALCSMLDRDQQWLLAHTIRDVIHPDDLDEDLSARDALLNGDSGVRIRECRWLRSDGSAVWVEHSTGLLRDEQQLPLFYVSHVQDNTDSHRVKALLAHRANHDDLTGLINRGQLQERITDVLDLRSPSGGVPGLLFCDIDHFKDINDTYGHASGDDVLRIGAERMASAVRAGDIVARLGGDEFVVVLNDVRDLSAAVAVAQKIRDAVSEPMPIGQGPINITTSIGIALADCDIDAHRLLRNADAALYEAKHSGRNRIAAFSDRETRRFPNHPKQPTRDTVTCIPPDNQRGPVDRTESTTPKPESVTMVHSWCPAGRAAGRLVSTDPPRWAGTVGRCRGPLLERVVPGHHRGLTAHPWSDALPPGRVPRLGVRASLASPLGVLAVRSPLWARMASPWQRPE